MRKAAALQVSVSVTTANAEADAQRDERAQRVKRFVQERFGFQPVQETRAYMTYLIGRDAESALPELLKQLEAETDALGITDIQVRHAKRLQS